MREGNDGRNSPLYSGGLSPDQKPRGSKRQRGFDSEFIARHQGKLNSPGIGTDTPFRQFFHLFPVPLSLSVSVPLFGNPLPGVTGEHVFSRQI